MEKITYSLDRKFLDYIDRFISQEDFRRNQRNQGSRQNLGEYITKARTRGTDPQSLPMRFLRSEHMNMPCLSRPPPTPHPAPHPHKQKRAYDTWRSQSFVNGRVGRERKHRSVGVQRIFLRPSFQGGGFYATGTIFTFPYQDLEPSNLRIPSNKRNSLRGTVSSLHVLL